MPLLFLISVLVDREPRLLKLRKHHLSFSLAWLSVELRWWSGGQNEQYAQLLCCVICFPVTVETDVFH